MKRVTLEFATDDMADKFAELVKNNPYAKNTITIPTGKYPGDDEWFEATIVEES